MDRPYPCSCVRNNVAGLIHFSSQVKGEYLGHNRVVHVPAVSPTLVQSWAATQDVAKEEGLALGNVTVGALPEDATVNELNCLPRR